MALVPIRVISISVGLLLSLTACAEGDTAADAAGDTAQTDAADAAQTEASSPTDTSARAGTADPPPASSMPEETASAPQASDRDFGAIGPTVEAFIDERGLDGAGLVVVDRDDGIVHEEYWGDFSADRVSFIASSSKMLTAGVLFRLHDAGLIDIDAPVADAVEWGAGNPQITPAQLLSNSSGLVGLGPNPAYGPYLCQFLPDGDIEDCGAQVMTTPDDDGDVVPPDTEFRYGGAQWQVAGALAEAASGRTWSDLIEETYVEPCGVDSLGYGNHFAQAPGFDHPADVEPAAQPPTDNPNMEGGAYIDPPDYARLLLMHLRGGECDGGRVLSRTSIERMHADRIGEMYGGSAFGDPTNGYGMGWWVDRTTGILSDPGAYGSVPWLDVADGYGAYLVIEDTSAAGVELADRLRPVVDEAMRAG